MNKLTFVFAALFVAAVYAAPDNFLASLKPFNHFKRAEALLKPVRIISLFQSHSIQMSSSPIFDGSLYVDL